MSLQILVYPINISSKFVQVFLNLFKRRSILHSMICFFLILTMASPKRHFKVNKKDPKFCGRQHGKLICKNNKFCSKQNTCMKDVKYIKGCQYGYSAKGTCQPQNHGTCGKQHGGERCHNGELCSFQGYCGTGFPFNDCYTYQSAYSDGKCVASPPPSLPGSPLTSDRPGHGRDGHGQ
eukprot:NODE_403_length_8041_cov_0.563712.p5 type:complete len:178 gc:universal NODE_403_length_8041_cov_0.563712:2639-2106(-)